MPSSLHRRLAAFAAALFGMAAAQPAMAGPIVINAPRAEAAANSQAHQGPNVAGSATTIVNGVTTSTFTSPGGGTSASGNAVAVSSSAFQNGSTNSGVALYNQTSASASLATGLLKATTSSTGPNNFGSPLGFAYSRIDDTFFFDNTTTNAVVATLTYSFDGAMIDPFGGNPGGSLGLSVSCSYFGCYNAANTPITFATGPTRVADGTMQYYFGLNSGYFGENIYGGQGSAPYFETFLNQPTAGGIVDGYIRTSFLIPTGQTSLGFSGYLSLDCRGASSCDFGHTGTFAFDPLPSGLNFSSASGVFPQAVAAGVPEPASWALMIFGFGFIGVAMRRGKGVTARSGHVGWLRARAAY